ncbi:unnamed protein product [Ostreobium quekettii]|uniref:Uncharacterized protein n=1 Tax=Ostreobium quekettii TaxID=121088 RepID=A0A8S1IU32_9CHLO|nr:unnamed protein product [Ostreobium quekettii]
MAAGLRRLAFEEGGGMRCAVLGLGGVPGTPARAAPRLRLARAADAPCCEISAPRLWRLRRSRLAMSRGPLRMSASLVGWNRGQKLALPPFGRLWGLQGGNGGVKLRAVLPIG